MREHAGFGEINVGVHKYDTNLTTEDTAQVKHEKIMIETLSDATHEQQV